MKRCRADEDLILRLRNDIKAISGNYNHYQADDRFLRLAQVGNSNCLERKIILAASTARCSWAEVNCWAALEAIGWNFADFAMFCANKKKIEK